MSKTVWPAGSEGPRESLACDGKSDHHLRTSPLGLLQEQVRCQVCGMTWTRRVKRVDAVTKQIVPFPAPTFELQPPAQRARRVTPPGRRRRLPEDEVPTSFSELEARRREQAEDLGLRPRRRR